MRMSETPADIEAEITFVPTEQGGRQGPARSGYRPQLHYDGRDWDAAHVYPDRQGEREWVHPGETVRAHLSFLSPTEHVGKLCPGTAFQFREGQWWSATAPSPTSWSWRRPPAARWSGSARLARSKARNLHRPSQSVAPVRRGGDNGALHPPKCLEGIAECDVSVLAFSANPKRRWSS